MKRITPALGTALLMLAALSAHVADSAAATPVPDRAPGTVTTGNSTRGSMILIGGGDVEAPAAIRKFVDLAGGPAVPIVVIPTASEEPGAAEYYTKRFTEGAACTNVAALDIKTREDAARADYVALVEKARGVFFGGGDQVRITNAILDTPVGKAIADAFARGAVVGGTSAGTACQSALMITGEGDFTGIRDSNVELKPGFGFFKGVIVDQHFIKRQRENRLISVILEHPDLLGVGVDEDTAIWVRPDDTFEVLGVGSVIVLDPGKATVARARAVKGQDLLGVRDLVVHVLLPGEQYDLAKRAVIGKRAGK
jgi:cyanophycinase